MSKIILSKADIVDCVLVCPYCMNDAGSKSGCCGESSGHFEKAFITKDDDCYLASEVILKEDIKTTKMAVIKHESYNS